MSKELIVWKKAITKAGLSDLGVCYDLFENNKMLLVKKNNDKLATLMFKDVDKDLTATVICSGPVNEKLREGKLKLAQLLGLTVLKGKYTNPKTKVVSEEEVMWLCFPATGWEDMVKPEAINYEDLAL